MRSLLDGVSVCVRAFMYSNFHDFSFSCSDLLQKSAKPAVVVMKAYFDHLHLKH